MSGEPLVKIENLYIDFITDRGVVKAIDGVSFDIRKGEILALIGETGCGKSVTAKAIMRLLPRNAIVKGKIIYKGRNLLELPEREMRKIRGKEIAMIFQDPLTSLNPVFTIEDQMGEMFKVHKLPVVGSILDEIVKLLKMVKIPDPEKRVKSYPFELSGGMRQRVMIAMMLSAKPSLLIADEPTTALDVTIQAQIMNLMLELREKFETSILLITHNPGVVAEMADRVVVMYAGQVVEIAPVEEIFDNPLHPYTQGLLRALPRGHKTERELENIPGRVPNLLNPPKGCRFHPRCKKAKEMCSKEKPKLIEVEKEHYVACHLYGGR
ncbi:ABC transporter ATP-binding protein [Pyrococcus abyssi]|uniref:Dipeptide ABC transporter, dipeptide-binding protein n=1 Tax=Pyrococcus abyssi (strain GE5 / Orsay) TaxID=272844 RepID=Q9V2C9_PYRAB|nr:ABC transporter ATP-binding protein [Pyrococcus abyssi]CAB49069.1 ABC transporter, ATP-binding protein, substrate unknown [Pyrococcus abyssi GE5]CCE69521.1 TPA: dipeptide ABC transporter, dipeptide-binding protein [Pyrococcus abyssi GE5]